ncbi:mucin-5AC-like [Anopheles cruzii]|uniref:mucin-5AC-like n=1 Tax=Anopheles cruzii TaxID=68878 RepID=UPI0022EC852C|nr:mucin-5AC-like [Anopheles cruzii]
MTCFSVKCHPAQTTAMFRTLLLLALACGVLGQNVSSTTSTIPPEAIVNLDDDDFQLFLAGREPKAFSGSTTSSNSSVTTSTTPRTTTPTTTTIPPRPPRLDQDLPSDTNTISPLSTFDAELYVLGLGKAVSLNSTTYSDRTTISPLSTFDAELYVLGLGKAVSLKTTTYSNLPTKTTTKESIFRTTTTTPSRPQRPLSTTSTTSVPKIPVIKGSSWFEEGIPTTPNSDVLGQQFRPAAQDFTKWLMQQMNKQEVAFVPQHVAVCSTPVHAAWSSPVRPTTVAPFPAFSSGQPGGHQQSLHSQLQTSQQLTDGLLTLWTPSGPFIQTNGQRYTPPAVSYQTSTVTYGNNGVSHNNHYQIHHHQDLQQQQQQLPFPGSSHSTDTYLSHQKPTPQPGPQPTTSSSRAPIAIDRVPQSNAVFYSDRNYYYTQRVAPSPPQFRPYALQHLGRSFLINYS